MSNAGGAIGLILGGIITEFARWQWIFLVAVPIGVGSAYGALRTLPVTSHRRASVDVPGALAATIGLAALVFRAHQRRPGHLGCARDHRPHRRGRRIPHPLRAD